MVDGESCETPLAPEAGVGLGEAGVLPERSNGLLAFWLKPVVGAEFPLAEVDRAHELVESRTSVGKVVLIP